MARITEVLEFLKTLIHSTDHDTIKIRKNTLCDIKTCLQYTQEKVDFLELESQLQQEELQQWSHHSELVYVHNIETNSHKQQVNNVAVDSYPVPNEAAELCVDTKIQLATTKPIIRPWEKIVHNKHKLGLGYDKDVSFNILDYLNPVKF